MRVLQINIVYGEKSTGRSCLEIEKALLSAGHECCTAYGNGHHNSPNTYRIQNKAEYYIHNLLARITGLQGYFSWFATRRLIKFIKNYSPDIIHLQNLHANYLNLPMLFRYFSTIDTPIILNLHDCWPFTGKCAHYTKNNCYKWETQCKNCIALHSYPQSWFFDFSRKMYLDKKRGLSSIKNLTVVGVSDWICNQAKKSFLKDRPIYRIYNWIDQTVFRPYEENTLAQYGADPNKFTIIGVSANWTKGSPRYEDFMKLAELIDDSMQIVLVGQADEPFLNEKIIPISFTADATELAKLYSSSDVYVHFSVEDTFGKVIAEALSCGTPVVVYDSTACAEIVGENCGYSATVRSVDEVFGDIKKIQKNGKEYYSSACHARANLKFNDQINLKALMDLYMELTYGK